MKTRKKRIKICVDPLSCAATGSRVREINQLFRFKDLSNVTAIHQLGKSSNNAGVYCLTYTSHQGSSTYVAYAVLKTTRDIRADNLAYEYAVGEYINTLIDRHFPCFLQTYGLYRYESLEAKGRSRVTPLDGLRPVQLNVGDSCKYNDRQGLLIQYLPRAKLLEEFKFDPAFVRNDLVKILYQAYAVLARLSAEFTHYDLHSGNILIYEMEAPRQFVYGPVKFVCRYLTKIIDYGRCFAPPSHKMKNLACAECYACGRTRGYWFTGDFREADFHVDASQSNFSHDLIYLKQLRVDKGEKIKNVHPLLYDLLKRVKYEYRFGTLPLESDGINVNNVRDAAAELGKLIKHEDSNYEKIVVPV